MRTQKNKTTARNILRLLGIGDGTVNETDDTKLKIDSSFMSGDYIAMPNFNQYRNGTSQIVIKCSSSDIGKLARYYANKPNLHPPIQPGKSISIRFSQNYDFKNDYQVIKFVQTSKLNVNAAGVKVSDAANTAMAELGTLWVMRQAIAGNKTFNSPDDIMKDRDTWKELLKIWTLIGKLPEGPTPEWIETFYESNKAFLDAITGADFTEFNRGVFHANSTNYHIPGSQSSKDMSFMEWISEFVRDNYGISKKDNWNPADIWLIKNQKKWMKMIEKSCKVENPNSVSITTNLAQLNSILRQAYHQKEIIGVSLKKKTKGKDMIYVAVNTTEKFLADRLDTNFKQQYAYSKAQCYFDQDSGKAGSIMSQDSVIYCAKNRYSFQVKANSSSDRSGSGLKYEGTDQERKGARLGKATVSKVIDLMEEYNLKFDSNKTSYPFDSDALERNKAEWIQKITRLSRNDVEIYKQHRLTPEDAYGRLKYLFEVQSWVANSKCQQITWLDKVLALPTDDLNNFMADMSFLAQKEGKDYGPFGKIY